jgi:choline kinase
MVSSETGVEEAVVLAAGSGTRFPRTASPHKLLAKVLGYSLVEYPVRSIASAGLRRFVVVTASYLLKPISEVLKGLPVEVEYVVNDEVSRGNAYSLVRGLGRCRSRRVLVSMADHVYLPRAVERLLKNYRGGTVAIGVDRSPLYVDPSEATLVVVDRMGLVVRVGKGLGSWDYVDVGLHIASRDVVEYFSRCGEPAELAKLYECIATRTGDVTVVDLTGEPWVDVDTWEDYVKLAEGSLRRLALEVVGSWRV